MKKYFNYISSLLLVVIILINFNSCLDLDEKVYSDITEDNYKYKPGDATKTVGAAYTNLRGWTDAGAGLGICIAQAIASDEAVFPANGSGWNDGGTFHRMHQHKWNSEQEHVIRMWELFYKGVTLSNIAIDLLERDVIPLTANEDKNVLLAETRALRAFYYWYILDNFGDAPLVTKPTNEMPSKTDRKEIYDFVVNELIQSIPSLPVSKNKSNYGHFTKWGAKAVLANVYLNAEAYTGTAEWDACKKECDEIIASGQYTLDVNFSDPFKTNNENSLENIFVIPYDDIYAQGFNYHLASLHGANQRTYNLESAPWGAGAYKGTPQFIDTYDPDDERLKATWLGGPQYASDGTPLLGSYDKMGEQLVFVNKMPDGIFTSEAEGLRWLKYEIAMSSKWTLNNDYVLFRLTQVYLMKAECLLRTGNADQAASIVTTIRQRAFKANPAKAVVTGTQLQQNSSYKYGVVKDYILAPQQTKYPEKFGRFYDELGWEMAGETFRRRDMIRFGHYTKAAWLSHEPSENYRVVFPIPQKVVDANPNLEQNPNYK